MGPRSPPIWSRDWGPFLFFNQYERERRRDIREIERGRERERVERERAREREEIQNVREKSHTS